MLFDRGVNGGARRDSNFGLRELNDVGDDLIGGRFLINHNLINSSLLTWQRVMVLS